MPGIGPNGKQRLNEGYDRPYVPQARKPGEVLLSVLLPGATRDQIERRIKSWGVPLPRLLEVALDRLEKDVKKGRVDLKELSGDLVTAGGRRRA